MQSDIPKNQQNGINQLVHDARNPLNRISMQTELVKMLLPEFSERDKIIALLDKILSDSQKCSLALEAIRDANVSQVNLTTENQEKG